MPTSPNRTNSRLSESLFSGCERQRVDVFSTCWRSPPQRDTPRAQMPPPNARVSRHGIARTRVDLTRPEASSCYDAVRGFPHNASTCQFRLLRVEGRASPALAPQFWPSTSAFAPERRLSCRRSTFGRPVSGDWKVALPFNRALGATPQAGANLWGKRTASQDASCSGKSPFQPAAPVGSDSCTRAGARCNARR